MTSRLLWKRRAGRAWGSLRSPAAPRRIILTYHSVGSGPLSMPEHVFGEQMAWLAEHAAVVPLDALLARPGDGPLIVAVTFDDGYACVGSTAAPIMRRFRIAGTVFVNTSRIGDTERGTSDPADGYYPGESFLLWDEVRRLRDLGWVIGSHGVNHPDLTRETPAGQRRQLGESKQVIQDKLGEECRYFAYPFGYHDARVRDVAAACGYEWALAAVHGAVSPDAGRYAIPRIDIRRDFARDDFAAVVRGDWDYLRYVQSARHLLHTRFAPR